MANGTGSITDVNPGPLLANAIGTVLTAAGFTFVDTVNIGRSHKIWKSPAAGNSFGLDWYLNIAYPGSGVARYFYLSCFEYFDPATDLAYRGPYGTGTSTTIDPTTFSPTGSTGYNLDQWIGVHGGSDKGGFSYALTTTSFTYWISATPDRVVVMTTISPTRFHYAGFYQPTTAYAAKAGVNLFPLIACYMYTGQLTSAYNTSDYGIGLTRLPPVTTLTGRGWGNTVSSQCIPSTAFQAPAIPGSPTTAYPYVAWPITIFSGWDSQAALKVVYGSFMDVAQMNVSNTVVRGDTCTIGGNQWMFATTDGTTSLMFKVA